MAQGIKLESVKIRGFSSLAGVELTGLPNVALLIGPGLLRHHLPSGWLSLPQYAISSGTLSNVP